jgi:hypothetical protein
MFNLNMTRRALAATARAVNFLGTAADPHSWPNRESRWRDAFDQDA